MSNGDDSLLPSGQTIQKAFDALITALERRKINYCVIGGIASSQHTRARTTDDIDALLTVPQLALPGLFEELSNNGFVVDVMKNISEFRDGGLTSVTFGEVIVDLLRPILPVYAHVLDRAINAEILGRTVRVCTVEDLIITKLLAMRPQDEFDIQELLTIYSGKLDLGHIRSEFESASLPNDPRQLKFESWVQQLS